MASYDTLLGGSIGPGSIKFDQPVAKVPARNIPDMIVKLLEFYSKNRKDGETFSECVGEPRRDGGGRFTWRGPGSREVYAMTQEAIQKKKTFVSFIQVELGELTTLPTYEEALDKHVDWGYKETFKVKTARGECAT
jgi:hypothetical protein